MARKMHVISKFSVFSESHPFKLTWDVVMMFAILASSITVPYHMVFVRSGVDILYGPMTLIFLFDILINFNTVVRVKRRLLTHRRDIAAHYAKTWLGIDLLAALPFAALLPFFSWTADPWLFELLLSLRLVRIVKLFKVNSTLRHFQEGLSINPSLIRLVFFIFWFVLGTHYLALGWILIGAGTQIGEPLHRYLLAAYWTVSTVTTIGYGDITPDKASSIQVMYAMFTELLGVGVFGFVIGNISSLITGMDANKTHFMKKMDEIDAFFQSRKLPLSIQKKVREYYSYLWETRKSADVNTMIGGLPRSLQFEIALHLNAPTIRKVSLFKDLDEDFVGELAQFLEPLVFLPGDFIIKQGEHGDCMFFLASGEAEVLVDDVRVAQLGSGSPFGEAALVEHEKRNASIRALSYCDVYKLSKRNFEVLRERYAEFDKHIKDIIEVRRRERLEKTGKSSKETRHH